MLVAARNHQHLITLKTMIPGKDIRRQVCPSDMPQMKRTIGIRPGNPNKNSLSQFYPSRLEFYFPKYLLCHLNTIKHVVPNLKPGEPVPTLFLVRKFRIL